MNKKILVFSILFITLINLVGAQTYTCAPDGKTVSKDGNIAIKFCGSVEQSCSNGECIGNPCPGFETSCSSDEKWRFAKCSSSVDFGIYENCDQQGKTCINGECVGEPQIECGTITKNIVLTKNLVSEDTCFTIGADNIVIDGNGYSITGNENGNGVFSEDHSSITIKNLKINNFKYGIELKKSSNSEIYNNNIIISGNYASGIKLLTDSAQNNIHDNEIIIENEYSSARYGIHVENSENNNIKKNTISTTSKNVGGILLKLTSNNIIEDNIISLEGSTLNRGAILFADANNNIINNNDLDSKSDFEIYMSHVSSSGDLSGNRFSKVKIHNTIISSDNFYYSSMKNEDPQSLPNIEGVKLSDYLYISSFNTNPGHIDFNIHYDPSGIDENTIILYYLDSETNSWESFSTSTIDKEKNIISSGLIQFPFISKSYIHVVLIGQEIENQVCPNDCTNGCLNGECIIDELSCTPDNIRETVQSGDYKVAFNTYNRQHPLNSNPLIDSIVTFINVTYLGDKVETKLVYLKMECPKTDKYPNGFSSEPSYWFETLPNQTVIINGPSYTIPLDETLSRNCKFSFRVDENILVVNECIHAPPFDEDASCIDNDGLDMATKGTTKKSPYTYTDYCGFRGILREYSCTGNTVRTTVMTTCEINCVDGKCISSTEPTCTDADLDSYESSSCGGEDCDDTNANIFPGQSDLCDDIDNDCDNAIDEDCICIENEIISCGETNLGECEYGTQYCTNNAWGDCTNYIGSENEICDGLDNNCDGTIDEGCDCTNGEIISCGDTNLGICTIGQQTCTNGVWSECQGLISPSEEFCDNIDNNCDGVIDDNCKCIDGENKACGTSDIGICTIGQQTCTNGEWSECQGSINSIEEICDSLDNDCDGSIDENCEIIPENIVKICHFPPGNPENAKVIEIIDTELPGHINNHRNDELCTKWCDFLIETDEDISKCHYDEINTCEKQGGLDYYSKGTMIVDGNQNKDTCCVDEDCSQESKSGEYLLERICIEGLGSGELIKCDCKNGKCNHDNSNNNNNNNNEPIVIKKNVINNNNENNNLPTFPNKNNDCDGCLENGNCFSYGTRQKLSDIGLYCSFEGSFNFQKEIKEKCENNYECKTNSCVNEKCVNFVENKGIIKSFINWLTNIFGKK